MNNNDQCVLDGETGGIWIFQLFWQHTNVANR